MIIKRGHLRIQLTKEELGDAWLEYQQILNKETDDSRKGIIRDNLETLFSQGKIGKIPAECMDFILDKMVNQVRENETDYDSDLEYEMTEGLIYKLNEILSEKESFISSNPKTSKDFSSMEEMLGTLQSDFDLYNILTEEYVFKYNTDDAIAVYKISLQEAKELEKKSQSSGEYWGAYLGPGGSIFDSPAEYCTDKYNLAGWINVTPC